MKSYVANDTSRGAAGKFSLPCAKKLSPAPDRVGVNFPPAGGANCESLIWMCGSAMLLKSRENADLFRLPERWRRRLRMRLACSLASVSPHTETHTHAHTVHRKDTRTPSDGFEKSLLIFVETFASRWAYRKKCF